ncbi:ABC transporter type 1, transmembrane domain-containing protein, partial [Chytriomyces sp. MP71]
MDLSGFPARLLVSSAMLLTSVALRADGEANFTDETRPLLSGGSQPSVASIPFLFVTRCIALIQIGLVLAETCALPLLNTSFGISKMTSCLIELLAWIVMLRMCSAWPNQLRLERPFTQLTTRLPLFGFLATSTSLLHLDVVGFKISESALCTIFLAVRTLSSAFSLSLAFLALFQSSSISAEAIEYAESMVKESGGMLPCPEPNQVNFSNAVSVISFGWMNSLMRLGGKRPIEMKDLPELGTESKAENASERFRKNRTRFKYLFTALVVTEAKSFIFQASFAVLAIVSGLSLPYFLYKITGFIERPGSEQEYMGYIYAALFVLCAFVKRLCDTHAWHISRNVGVRIKAMLVNEIYCKSLKIIPGGKSNSAPSASSGVTEDASSGKIVTLMSTDAEQVRDRIPELCDISVMPFQIIAAIVGLLYVIGWSALAGLLVMCLTFIATFYNSKWSVRVYQRLLSAQDDRTSIVNEVLQGIRIVKYFAWEERFLAKIDVARQREMRSLVHLYITDVLGNLIFLAAPLAVSFTTLLVLTKYAGVELNSQMAFTCLSLFNNLRYPLMYLPGMVSNVFKLKVALGRISDFLNQSELEQYPVRPIGQDEGVLGFKNATLAWILSGEGENGGFQLRNLDLSFPTGAVSIISGATGSGKSSLIHGILGEMKLLSGTAFLPARNEVDSFAYVPQTAWLMNASLRENILFGQPMDISRYNSVLQACALLKDLDLLEARDMTEIGEKGINLSGGQKQRISIARALYSSAKT